MKVFFTSRIDATLLVLVVLYVPTLSIILLFYNCNSEYTPSEIVLLCYLLEVDKTSRQLL